jgi:hypothetical protein
MSPKVSILALPLVLAIGCAAHASEIPGNCRTQAGARSFEPDRITGGHASTAKARNWTRAIADARGKSVAFYNAAQPILFWSGTPKTSGWPAIVVH